MARQPPRVDKSGKFLILPNGQKVALSNFNLQPGDYNLIARGDQKAQAKIKKLSTPKV